MAPCPLYSSELTKQEEILGFVRAYVPNPDHCYYGHSSISPAVVLRLGASDRLIKLINPMGGFSYPRQIFGAYRNGDDVDWKPVNNGLPNLELAVRQGRQGQHDVNYVLAPAKIALRCPKCAAEFEVQADYLPIGGNTTCPTCNHTSETAQFDAPNV